MSNRNKAIIEKLEQLHADSWSQNTRTSKFYEAEIEKDGKSQEYFRGMYEGAAQYHMIVDKAIYEIIEGLEND